MDAPKMLLLSIIFILWISSLEANKADVRIPAVTSFPWPAGYYPLFAHLTCWDHKILHNS